MLGLETNTADKNIPSLGHPQETRQVITPVALTVASRQAGSWVARLPASHHKRDGHIFLYHKAVFGREKQFPVILLKEATAQDIVDRARSLPGPHEGHHHLPANFPLPSPFSVLRDITPGKFLRILSVFPIHHQELESCQSNCNTRPE